MFPGVDEEGEPVRPSFFESVPRERKNGSLQERVPDRSPPSYLPSTRWSTDPLVPRVVSTPLPWDSEEPDRGWVAGTAWSSTSDGGVPTGNRCRRKTDSKGGWCPGKESVPDRSPPGVRPFRREPVFSSGRCTSDLTPGLQTDERGYDRGC